ncbi:hypothetical protein QVD17_14196 [Tagetes erecta]|uniref:Uncharacterized protein n=1 Tax=Tagetes erecta TaxID=13708 RepID=A0AAD8L1D5_TARER|nr:hypothetical protein QVD17_14196 [Tagetes erecta]
MSENATLPKANAGGGGDNRRWNNILDWKEANNQIVFSLPLVLTNVAYYLIPLASVMFAGHHGQLHLAAANLANSWATVTGLAFMVGLSGALETLCGQGFGAKLYRMLGIYLQACCCISIFFSVLISILCLEYWAFELLVLLAGLLPNSGITTSVIAICANTEAIAFMFTIGLSAAASTRVSNELGARNTDGAKHAMAVTLMLSVILSLAVVLALGFGHDIWSGSFSGSPEIAKQYASMTPLLMISILLDSIQGVLSGVARGCGWQQTAMYINLAMFYLIGMPAAVALAFSLKLYAKGLWIGLICGLTCQTFSLVLLVHVSKWEQVELGGSDSLDDGVIA